MGRYRHNETAYANYQDKDIRFISHLEYVRTIGRAIRRAKLPAAYSEGFNPHLKFSLASALGVGVVSYTEFVEIELAEPMEVEKAALALDAALPRGIRVLAADAVDTHHAALMSQAAGASYRVTLPYSQRRERCCCGVQCCTGTAVQKSCT